MAKDHPPRLARLAEIYIDAPVFFVTACTHDRVPRLADPEIHTAFREFCESSPEHGAFVGAYVLLPDHFHLFVSVGDGDQITLSRWIKALKNTLSSIWRKKGLPTPYWQKGFFDHLLRSDDSYAEKIDYIYNNPVRAGLVTMPEHWPYLGDFQQL